MTPILHPLFLCLVLSFPFNPLRSILPPHSLLRALSSRCSRNLSPRLASILSSLLCPLGPSHFRSLRPPSPFPASRGRISLAISLRARDIFPLKAPENSSASAVPFSNLSRMAPRDPAVDSHPFSRCTATSVRSSVANKRRDFHPPVIRDASRAKGSPSRHPSISSSSPRQLAALHPPPGCRFSPPQPEPRARPALAPFAPHN